MSQRFLSGLSAALVLSTLGAMPSSYGSEAVAKDDGVEENVSAESALANRSGEPTITDSARYSNPEFTSSSRASSGHDDSSEDRLVANSSTEVSASHNEQQDSVKVGEYQNQSGIVDDPAAVIHTHVMDGREAVTVYVEGIPVLTLLGDEAIAQSPSQPVSPVEENSAEQAVDQATNPGMEPDDSLSEVLAGSQDDSSVEEKAVKLPGAKADASPEAIAEAPSEVSAQSPDRQLASRPDSNSFPPPVEEGIDVDSPVQQATAIAARINQVSRDGIDPSDIIAAWDDESETYVIKVGDTVLIEFDTDVILPDTTGNIAEDVLQATNRIRRQLGAAPLTSIEGAPNSSGSYVAVGPVQFSFRGVASWYGPGFHGRRSASGEIFNQNAMTAAHRTLPFGTLVRVTNLNNGESVTVRITDRGPFGGGRVIDLSAGAARAIGMIQAGVATVQAEVLSSP